MNAHASCIHARDLRARFRDSLERPANTMPGQIYKYEINVWPTSNVFLPGHQIRLEVSSSNFPHYDRNPNTGHPFGVDTAMWPAFQTIYHDAEHPSALTLPIMSDPMKPQAAN